MPENYYTGAEKNDSFLVPEKVIAVIGVQPGDHAADFGAGHGYFTIPLAQRVGGNGKVYAVDIQKSALGIIRNKAHLLHLLNIELIWGNLDEPNGSKLKDQYLEFVLISNMLFQTEFPEIPVREAYRVLREGGKTAVIEWDNSIPGSLGPAQNEMLHKEDTKTLFTNAGFSFEREFDAGSHHYGLLFVKK